MCSSLSTADGKNANRIIENIPDDSTPSLRNGWTRISSGSSTSNGIGNKLKTNLPVYILSAYRRNRINPPDFEFIDDTDVIDKRAGMDDYGHLRFGKRQDGKRNQDWEDYGHMRFGRR